MNATIEPLEGARCDWCDSPATWRVLDPADRTDDYACQTHLDQWRPTYRFSTGGAA